MQVGPPTTPSLAEIFAALQQTRAAHSSAGGPPLGAQATGGGAEGAPPAKGQGGAPTLKINILA